MTELGYEVRAAFEYEIRLWDGDGQPLSSGISYSIVEAGRYPVAGAGLLVCRVKDIKQTESNAKGPGQKFIMVDAGFNDLVRPAMYGSYHHISILGNRAAWGDHRNADKKPNNHMACSAHDSPLWFLP